MDSAANQDYLNMHKEIINEVAKLSEKVTFADLELDDSFLQAQIKEHNPMSSVIDFPIDSKLFLSHLDDVIAIVEKHQPHLKDSLDDINASFKSLEDLSPLIEATKATNYFYFEELAKTHKLNTAILQFIVEMAYRPFLKAFSELINSKVKFDEYGGNTCPVCGETVRILRTADEGKREACCTRCDTVWEVKRLQCPHCKNNNHDKLRFLTADASESKKLYVCEECKGYVKLVDTKDQLGKPSFFLIDLETIYLDMIAVQQGYEGPKEVDNKKIQ